ncbi:hypothetical protein D3C87_1942280 [compost metagenome]
MEVAVYADERCARQRLRHAVHLLDQAAVMLKQPLRAGVGRRLQPVLHGAQVLFGAIQLRDDARGVRLGVFRGGGVDGKGGVVRG